MRYNINFVDSIEFNRILENQVYNCDLEGIRLEGDRKKNPLT